MAMTDLFRKPSNMREPVNRALIGLSRKHSNTQPQKDITMIGVFFEKTETRKHEVT